MAVPDPALEAPAPATITGVGKTIGAELTRPAADRGRPWFKGFGRRRASPPASARPIFHRIDDICVVRPDLMMVLQTFVDHDLACLLAVIPDRLRQDMAAFIRAHDNFCVFQHGCTHQRYAASEAADEFPSAAGPAYVSERIEGGRRKLEDMLERPVLGYIPPWNQLSGVAAGSLRQLGFRHLSSGVGQPSQPALRTLNPHIDTLAAYDPVVVKTIEAVNAEVGALPRAQGPIGFLHHVRGLPQAAQLCALVESVVDRSMSPAAWNEWLEPVA